MPLYNAERYVAHALNSIFAQDYPIDRIETIVVDDGSTDASAAVVHRFGDRITYHRQENAGPAAARNTGLRHVTGDFVTFLDADDSWHPRKLTQQIAEFETNPDLEASICLVRNYWSGDPRDQAAQFRKRGDKEVMIGIVVQALLVRRALVEAIGEFDVGFRFGEDSDWYMRLNQSRRPIAILNRVLGYRRIHPLNMTREFPPVREDTMFQVLKAAIDRSRAGRAPPGNDPDKDR